MRRLTTGIRSEKCVVRRFRRCANVYLHKPRYYSLLHTQSIWHSLLLLGYKPVQHITVLNTVGNCNTMVSIIILWDHRSICGLSLTETSLCGALLQFKICRGKKIKRFLHLKYSFYRLLDSAAWSGSITPSLPSQVYATDTIMRLYRVILSLEVPNYCL